MDHFETVMPRQQLASAAPRTIAARFDDCADGGEHFVLEDPAACFVAREINEVADVLRAASDAAANGAWVAGFVSYDAAPAFDDRYLVRTGQTTVPLAWFASFAKRTEVDAFSGEPTPIATSVVHDMDEEDHRSCVVSLKEAIARGETYQVNLTNTWRFDCAEPETCYRSLVLAQHGRHHAMIDTGEIIIACASPELFYERVGNTITSRPMKGTAARGRTSEEDHHASVALKGSEKELAENVIVVDMVRNDLGRIAEVPSVAVSELATVERLPTVLQLTSTVTAKVCEQVTIVDTFSALFPPASITGAPRHSTMGLIATHELSPRGIYCGAIGYLAPGPRRHERFSVAIRTAVLHPNKGTGSYGTGGGITWSSDPAQEWNEQVLKGAILTRPLARPSLFETMALREAAMPDHFEKHLERLACSADYFSIPFDQCRSRALVEQFCDTAARPARLRLELSSNGELSVTVGPAPARNKPVRLAVASTTVDHRDPRLFHKCVDRRVYDNARASVGAAPVDDVILVNDRGEVTETTIANLAVELEGRWWTPSLDCGLLAGVERQRRLADGTLAERHITVSDLSDATALATLSALRGWRPARLV